MEPGGDVAQLGERLVRNEEVGGSSPLISTIFPIVRSEFGVPDVQPAFPRAGAAAGSHAMVLHEFRQDRKVAAVSGRDHVTWSSLAATPAAAFTGHDTFEPVMKR